MAIILASTASFGVGVLLTTWVIVFDASTNVSEIGAKIEDLLGMSHSEAKWDEIEKAWFLLDYDNPYGDTVEFDPTRKSLKLLRKDFTMFQLGVANSRGENENFGIFAFLNQSDDNEELDEIFIQKLNKVTQVISIITSVSAKEYDHKFIAVTEKNIVLFTKNNGTGCQEIQLMYPDGQISGIRIPMLNCRQRPSCVASTASGDIYIFGVGESDSDDEDSGSEKYDLDSGKFVAIDLIPDPEIIQESCKAIEHRGKIFVCSNKEDERTGCACYYPELNRWKLEGKFEIDRVNFELESIGGSLYAIWGDYENYLDSIEKYNEFVGMWESYMVEIPTDFQSDYFVPFSL